jgi:hypothetical protein
MKKLSIMAMGLLCAALLFPQMTYSYSLLFGPSLFSPRSNYVDYFQDATELYVNPGSVDRSFTAPVFIPHTARVQSLVFFFKDNSTASLQFQMRRINIYDGRENVMCSLSTVGNISDWQRTKITRISKRDINNNGFLYYFSLRFSEGMGNTLALRAIKINYELIT